jgi:L-threonylcarbamoyladenylate synthase
MTRLLLDPLEPDQGMLREAAAILARGGIVAYPTDTLYGLAVDPRNEAAVRALFAVKGRAPGEAIPLIAATEAQARQAGAFGPGEAALAAGLWPGPLTIVVPASPLMSRLLSGERGTLGVRVPAHRVARDLAAAFGGCITATSANRSGRPPAATADAVAAAFHEGVDMLLDAGPVAGGPPSTLVEIAGGRPLLQRAGAVPWDRVQEFLE